MVADASFDRSDYTADELAAWDWYQKQIEPDHWKAHVFAYREKEGEKLVTPPEDFDPEKPYMAKDSTGFDPPDIKPFSGESGSAGSIAVSTDAINHLIEVLGIVAPDGSGMMFDARADLDQVNVRPGAFAKAEFLRTSVMGTSPAEGGLRGETMTLLLNTHLAIFAVREDLVALLKTYKNGEELNTLTVDKLDDAMRGSEARIDRLGSLVSKDKNPTGG